MASEHALLLIQAFADTHQCAAYAFLLPGVANHDRELAAIAVRQCNIAAGRIVKNNAFDQVMGIRLHCGPQLIRIKESARNQRVRRLSAE